MTDRPGIRGERAEWMDEDASPDERVRRVEAMADHEIERAIVLLSGLTAFVDDRWLPLLVKESRRRNLAVTREN